MLKLVGIVLIIFAGVGMGFEKSAEFTRREKYLTELIQIVLFLRGEIRCGNSSLAEAFYHISLKMSGVFSEFAGALSAEMKSAKGESFGELFRRCVIERAGRLSFSREEQAAFMEIGNHLGYLDREMQLQQLALCQEELERLRENLRLDMAGKKKIYRGLGLFGALLLSVLIW